MDRLNGHHILVIEDDYLISASIVDELIERGATVVAVSNQRDALKELSNWHFTAAVVDINLGHGPDFTSATKLQRERIPFVFITGYDLDMLASAFENVPALRKPHDTDQLAEALLSAINLAAA
ncbi:response regulator (plasmid) [Aliirhizobium terrae]|uniref:response regulator n=1 Tax=Terrirhizobium terrae TaxID=2926709 RepID=UPI002574E7BB|nr:response regulator [Rhizobium sp. CC-CFT758]WJH38539.1 response regulator [Rhizobium sp. CC-CFT758]